MILLPLMTQAELKLILLDMHITSVAKYNSFFLNVLKYHKILQYFKVETTEFEAGKTEGP